MPATTPVPTRFLQRILTPVVLSPVLTAETRSAESGRYVAEGIGSGVYRVTAIGGDGERAAATAELPVDGATVELDLTLGEDTGALRGRIIDIGGRPFDGSVFVEPAPPSRQPSWRPDYAVAPTPIDAEGRFRATGLARGEVIVYAVKSGTFRATSRAVSIPREDEFVWVLDKGRRLRVGSVVAEDGSGPVAGALLFGGGTTDETSIIASTTTDAAGAFALSLAPSGGGLRAVAPGFLTVRKELSELPAGDEPIVFRLPRGATITGRVTDAADGHAVAGVSVRAIPEGRELEPEAAVSDEGGRFTIDGLAAGEVVVLADGNGWVSKGVAETGRTSYNPFLIPLKPGEAVKFDVTVVRSVSIFGGVLDPAGAPIVGAVVRCQPREPGGGYYFANPLERLGDRTGVSGGDGSFSVGGLVPDGTYVATATTRDGAECRSPPFVVADGSVTRLELRFSPERRVQVTVLDAASGLPIAGAAVVVSTRADYFDREIGPPKTDAHGQAAVVTRSVGDLSARVTADGYLEPRNPEPVPASGDLIVRLKKGLLLAGRAVLADSSPAAGATVGVNPGHHLDEDPWTWETETGPDGTFRFTCSSTTERTVRATIRIDGHPFEGEATGTPDGPPLAVTLKPVTAGDVDRSPGTLIVRVVDGEGNPVPAAYIEIGRDMTSAEEVRDGRASYRQTDAEIEWINVWGARAADGSPLPLGPAHVGRISLDAREVEMRLPQERAIEGVVLGPDSRGVRGAVVRATWKVASESGHDRTMELEVRTDADGRFRVGRLGPDECRLTVDAPREMSLPAPVTARGGDVGVQIRLTSTVRVAIRVLDEAGKPIAGIVVSARPLADGARDLGEGFRTDASGVAHVTGLSPEATYELRARDDRDTSSYLEYTRTAWKPRDETIELAQSLRIRGVVRDPKGRAVANARVYAILGDVMRWPVTSDADGTFTIVDLARGPVQLRASIERDWDWDDAKATTVQAGDDAVVLTIDPGLELVVRVESWPVGRPNTVASLTPHGIRAPGPISAEIGPDGVARFRGLQSDGVYTLWIPPVGSAWSLLQRDVRAATTELRVRLVLGKSITGRISSTVGARSRSVVASQDGGSVRVPGIVGADGTYEIQGLSPGDWTVEASGRAGTARLGAHGAAPAGDVFDLELKPE